MPPVNDDFANATLLSAAGGTLQDDNTGATSDGANDPLVNVEGNGPETIWYKLDPDFVDTRALNISTTAPISGTQIDDSVIGVYTGTTLAGLTLVKYDDDDGPGRFSLITNAIIDAGETVYVEVAGYSTDVGAFTLTWSLAVANPPPNDDIADAIELTGAGGTVSGTNVGATIESDESDDWFGDDPATVWYRWHNTTPGVLNVTFENLVDGTGFFGFGAIMYLFVTTEPGAVSTWTQMYDGYITSDWIRGITYSSSSLDSTMAVQPGDSIFVSVSDYEFEGLQDVFTFDWQVDPPSNDDVVDAIELSGLSQDVEGNNVYATSESDYEQMYWGNPSHTGAGRVNAPTVWYSWENDRGFESTMTVTDVTSDFPLYTAVLDAWTFTGTPTGFQDLRENGVWWGSAEVGSFPFDFPVADGDTVYFSVTNDVGGSPGHNDSEWGDFAFTYSVTPPDGEFISLSYRQGV